MKNISLISIPLLCMLAACGGKVPEGARPAGEKVKIFPDYTDVAIPVNIAPMNFKIGAEGEEFVTHLYSRADADGIKVKGEKVMIPEKKWKELLAASKGDTLMIDIYARKGGEWLRFPTVKNFVAPDTIDSYLSYRLIEPSYVSYEMLSINERDLTGFSEGCLFNNMKNSDGEKGQCVNCHNYQDWNRSGNMQLHLRQEKGGTVIYVDGETKKVDLKTDATISSGVYPAWHPTAKLIAYSVNNTAQNFHTGDRNKIEVFDSASDVILYDVEKNTISVVAADSASLESCPAWSPDGKWLYYISATPDFDFNDGVQKARNYNRVKYDILRKPFDEASRTFGAADTVFRASAMDKSAAFPRISPDGKMLLTALGEYGQFHIWHKDADLYIIDLESGEARPLTAANSDDVESYHSWSSNGRWVVFSSRRDDGSYTRPYFSWISPDGKDHKAFILPQKDPDFYKNFFKSYNVPEFMVCPVAMSRRDLVRASRMDATKASLSGKWEKTSQESEHSVN